MADWLVENLTASARLWRIKKALGSSGGPSENGVDRSARERLSGQLVVARMGVGKETWLLKLPVLCLRSFRTGMSELASAVRRRANFHPVLREDIAGSSVQRIRPGVDRCFNV
jgi:hypothetical protein